MLNNVLGALAGIVWGLLAAVVNYLILKKKTEQGDTSAIMNTGFVRTLVDVAALGAVFLLRSVLPFSFTVCLFACAVAMSMGTIVFTFLLAKK